MIEPDPTPNQIVSALISPERLEKAFQHYGSLDGSYPDAGEVRELFFNIVKRVVSEAFTPDPEAERLAFSAYQIAAYGSTWKQVAIVLYEGQKPDDRIWADIGQSLRAKAKKFAKRHGKPWPPES